jgi:hypothetical protein
VATPLDCGIPIGHSRVDDIPKIDPLGLQFQTPRINPGDIQQFINEPG